MVRGLAGMRKRGGWFDDERFMIFIGPLRITSLFGELAFHVIERVHVLDSNIGP